MSSPHAEPWSRREFLGGAGGVLGAASLAPPDWLAAPPPADLPFAGALQAAQAIRAKRVSSVELTRMVLDRIARLNPRINAIIQVLGDTALAEAKSADKALAGGHAPGLLHGVPVTVKDCFEINGVKTTAGFEPLRDYVPKQDAVAVARLRRAGAVILGHTNVPPLAGDWQSDNPIYGRSSNPWDLGRTPGGSSGGSAAALAAGLGYLSIGSDIGGSIRVPAHFCGIYGHKPTINVVPLAGHIPPLPGGPPYPAPTLPVAGPMARRAEDLLLGLKVLGGPDADDAVAYRWTLPPPRRVRLTDYRVGYVLDHPACPLASDVKAVLASAIEAMRRAGLRLEEGWPGGIEPNAQFAAYMYLVSVAVFAEQLDQSKLEETRQLAARGGDGFDVLMARAQTDPTKQVVARERERMAARAAWRGYFHEHDAFLMPACFTAGFPHDPRPMPQRSIATPEGPRPYMDLAWWIAAATFTGCPATVAPAGRTVAGLPVGLQIVGPYLEDATPIDLAVKLADVLGGFQPPPGY